MTAFQVYDCVSFVDETGARRVGNVNSIVHSETEDDVANVVVPGFRDAFAVKLADLAHHAECGAR